MGLARTHAVALLGIDGALVEVEAHVGTGLPKFALVGLPDTALHEARDRVRAAIVNAGYPFPDTKLTVALSPATLPKAGSHFDLAIAAAIVAAGDHANGTPPVADPQAVEPAVASESEGVDPEELHVEPGESSTSAGSATTKSALLTPDQVADTVFIGELGLDGRVRPVRGLLPLVLAATRAGRTRVVVPAANAAEAALVDGVEAIGVHHLRQLVAYLTGEELGAEAPVRAVAAPAGPRSTPIPGPDLADVRGQAQARFGLEVAAAGGHHLLLIGPPGAGKTMLATRLPGLLPELDLARALEVTAVHSLAGTLDASAQLIRNPPFVDPHHTATVASLIGGGSRLARPGAVSLAHGGVLFLDEAPEFRPAALEALRQPMEGGEVLIARAAGVARYPAAFQLVLAANPCPCGQAGTRAGCTCAPQSRARYLARLSGPVRDRIDISWQMQPVSRADLLAESGEPEASAPVADRVLEARGRQRARFGRAVTNAAVAAAHLRRHHPPDLAGRSIVERAVGRGLLSARGADKVVRIAWTVADLRGVGRPGISECAIALTLRLGEPTDGFRGVSA